jgi:hypothetical protein
MVALCKTSVLLVPTVFVFSSIISPRGRKTGKVDHDTWREIGLIPSSGSNTRRRTSPAPVIFGVFDSLTRQMTGDVTTQFPRSEFQAITSVMTGLDPGDRLVEAQERGWEGLLEYYSTRGGFGDPWGGNSTGYKEINSTLLWVVRGHNIGSPLLVYEPCNFASSLVFYHVLEALYNYEPHWSLDRVVVKAIGQSVAAIALGSSFFHSSHTKLGDAADVMAIRLFLHISYQALVTSLPGVSVTSEVLHLSPQPRAMTGIQLSEALMDMYMEQPAREWLDIVQSLDLPDRGTLAAAILYTLLSLLLPSVLKDTITSSLFSSLPPDTYIYMTTVFVPGIEESVSEVDLSLLQRTDVFVNLAAVLKKFSSSILYIEKLGPIRKIKSFFPSILMNMRSDYRARVMKVAKSFSSLPSLDPRFSSGQPLYPGDFWCRTDQDHSNWHTQAAATMLDLVLLIDQIVSLVK